jgi:F0F1-type ATP synthase membrane subunit b/b'
MSTELFLIITFGTVLLLVQVGLWRMLRSALGEVKSEVKDMRHQIARIENILFRDDGPGPDPRV